MADEVQELREAVEKLSKEVQRLTMQLAETQAAAKATDCFLARTTSNIAGVVKPVALNVLGQTPDLQVTGTLHASYSVDGSTGAMTREWLREVGEAYQTAEPG